MRSRQGMLASARKMTSKSYISSNMGLARIRTRNGIISPLTYCTWAFRRAV